MRHGRGTLRSNMDSSSVFSAAVPNINYELIATQLSTRGKNAYHTVVNAPFADKLGMAWIFLGFICLFLQNHDDELIHLMAASDTDYYRLSVEQYNFDLSAYALDPITDSKNTIVRAIASGDQQQTIDWVTMQREQANPEAVRLNQANSGIAYSAVYPLRAKTVRGALLFNFYQYRDRLGEASTLFMLRYTDLVSKFLDHHEWRC